MTRAARCTRVKKKKKMVKFKVTSGNVGTLFVDIKAGPRERERDERLV